MTSKRRIIFSFVVFYSIFYFPFYLIELFFRYFGEPVPIVIVFERLLILCLGVFFYGCLRLRLYHPIYNRKYMAWLALTPWTLDKTLPNGPIHLYWFDAVILGFHLALAYLNIPFLFMVPLLCFLVAYLCMLWLSLILFGQFKMAVLLLFLAPFVIYPFKNLYVSIAVCCVLYCVGYYGLCLSLKRPWNIWYWKSDLDWKKKMRSWAVAHRVIGWPYKSLRADSTRMKITLQNAFIISLLIGWYLYIIQWFAKAPISYPFISFFVMIIAFGRMLVYMVGHEPPISLFGRFATGRLIIRGYDKIFVAPICAMVAGATLPTIFLLVGISSSLSNTLSLSIVIFLVLALPPSGQQWEYTGSHRIRHIKEVQQRPRSSIPASKELTRLMTGHCTPDI